LLLEVIGCVRALEQRSSAGAEKSTINDLVVLFGIRYPDSPHSP